MTRFTDVLTPRTGLKTIRTLAPQVQMIALTVIVMLSCRGLTAGETIFLEDGGVVSMEAENFTDRVNGATHSWELVSSADGISGSASNGQFVSASPNVHAALPPFDRTLTPYLDYAFRIATADTYFLHANVESAFGTGTNDSYWAHIVEVSDGVGGAVADWYAVDLRHGGNGVFGDTGDWRGYGYLEFDQVTRQPPSPTGTANWELVPGDYTLRIHMREDGTAIDKFVLQTSSTRPTGFGPPESVSLFLGPVEGDFDGSGVLDVTDVNQLIGAIADGLHDVKYDVSGDNLVTPDDLNVWAKNIKKTWFGDADLDGEFNSGDLITVFQAAKYELDKDANWNEGDWTGDHRFDSTDLIAAFQDGGYEQGPRVAANAVPEPASFMLMTAGLAGIAIRRRHITR